MTKACRLMLALWGLVSACSGMDPAEESAGLTARRHYLVITADGTGIPAGLEADVVRAGGRVKHASKACGALLVDADDGDFAAQVVKIKGVRSVVPDLTPRFERPFEGAIEVATGAWAGPNGEKGGGESAANPGGAPSDYWYPVQWGLKAIGAQAAWDRGYKGQGVRVAVLDTGVAYYPWYPQPPPRAAFHPDLAANLDLEHSTSFVDGEPYWQPMFTPLIPHGTHVMGIIAAEGNNGGGVVGVAPEATLIAVKVLNNANAWGTWGQILAGVCYAADLRVDVANMSLGGTFPRKGGCMDDGCFTAKDAQEVIHAFDRAVAYATSQGTTIIAASGNGATSFDQPSELFTIPASLNGVITVSATGPLGWAVNPRTADPTRPASYTSTGKGYVALAAPGGDYMYEPSWKSCQIVAPGFYDSRPCFVYDMVLSDSGYNNGVLWAAGTSMAVPHVAGLAALILSERGPMPRGALEAALRQTALDLGEKGMDGIYGAGFVHEGACVQTTCDEAGAQCGDIYDGCGGVRSCAGCGDGQDCYRERCCRAAADVCAEEGRECGYTGDPSCDYRVVQCGTCPGNDVCLIYQGGKCCTPTVCEDSHATCGSYYDAHCGVSVDCGQCGAGEQCNGGTCCKPLQACPEEQHCGWVSDGCSGWLYCGDCDDGQVCNDAAGTCCVPKTCEEVGTTCGFVDNGCGQQMLCDRCGPGSSCDPYSGTCCTLTCEDAGRQCGYLEACGNWEWCGGCDWPSVCDQDAGQCCTPTTSCATEGAACGVITDDCGQGQWCGECDSELACIDNACVPPPPPALTCMCDDRPRTVIEYCLAEGTQCPDNIAADRICHLACSGAGGLYTDWCGPAGACGRADPPAPPPELEPPVSPGPNRATCLCQDGTSVPVCTELDCGAAKNLDGVCANVCAVDGGLAAQTCAASDPACAGAPAPGTDLTRCICQDGVLIDACVEVDCDSGPAQDAACMTFCAANGGLQGTGCLSDSPLCASP